MNIEEIFKIAAAIIASLGGGALLIAASANWLGGIWAKKMLQNERAVHAENLESIKNELDLLKQKYVTRHHDKLGIYREIIHMVCEILREVERVVLGKQSVIASDVEAMFSLNRHKAYGYITLVSNQEVMNRYNELIDYFIPIIYEGKSGYWEEMRGKADLMLNAMRLDLGIDEGEITYQGQR